MVKVGGPCQGPGKRPGTICGVTEISDGSSWRNGGKHKPEHKGKPCCTKKACRVFLGVIPDKNAANDGAVATGTAAAAVGSAQSWRSALLLWRSARLRPRLSPQLRLPWASQEAGDTADRRRPSRSSPRLQLRRRS